MLPVMPLSHAGEVPVKPMITAIGSNEFLIVSILEGRGLAVFISGSGDPVRGTFEYSNYPVAVCKSFLSGRMLRPLTSCSSSLKYTTTPTWSLLCPTRVWRCVTSRHSQLNRLCQPPNHLPGAQTGHGAVLLGTHRATQSLPRSSRMPCDLYLYH